MFTRWPILLAQIKAGNNSRELVNPKNSKTNEPHMFKYNLIDK